MPDSQPDLWSSPNAAPVARRTDPDTSHAAARSIDPTDLRKAQRQILDLLRALGPATDEHILGMLAATNVEISPSGARTRRAELVGKGLVRDSGQRALTRSGRQTIMWEATR